MKIPKSEFVRFKKKFKELRNTLNLRCYKIYFKFKPLEDSFGMIWINQSGMVITVTYSSEISKENINNRPTPEECAAHEVAHLFISKLSYLAEERFIHKEEINNEEERMVRVLEKIL